MIREYIYFVDDNPNGTSGMTEEEIIRCKDCKHFNDGDCEELPKIVGETDYCSFAERKEE